MPGAPTWLEGGRASLISCNGLFTIGKKEIVVLQGKGMDFDAKANK